MLGRFKKTGEISVLVIDLAFNKETTANKKEIDPINIETLIFLNKNTVKQAKETIKIPIPFSEK
ncbi:hypothetical protein LEP1GSC116_3396 [Leptospira interrogans serovar Icterohaemorrhagiae str. Verdun HP]|uniref:Uncharacterized protein n=1 Tax=Leptospira interrogans serovar Icterohaemorrhagiae str. Verdun HP TaxID=1049910 RepID=M6R8B9_LEPIR|nr:hypothetical protein LEP1GSC116_3396 [Leptospira interrogans serovar Icterohaemorrhagiae str. Verdun HP]